MVSEYTIEDYLVKRVKELGGLALKAAIPGHRFLDRLVILPGGRTVYAELKRPKGGRLSAHQEEMLRRLRELGHEAWVMRTKEDVDHLLAYGDVIINRSE